MGRPREDGSQRTWTPEKKAAYAAEYRKKNAKAVSEANRLYRKRHKTKLREYFAKWYKKNKKAYNAKRAKKRGRDAKA